MADEIQVINNGETAADIRRKINGNTTIINNNVTNVSNQVTNVTNNVQQITQQVTSITNEVTAINNEVTTISGDIVTINNTVNENVTNVTNITDSIGAIEEKKQDLIVGAATTILDKDLDSNRVLVTNEVGKIGISTITALELNALSGIKGGIQGQLDNIPKYNYLTGINITVNDDDTQSSIDTQIIQLLSTTYPTPKKWDSVVVAISFIPSDIKKDAQFYFNGTNWIFQYNVSTGINRSNGTFAGIVESSDDITFNDGQGHVNSADKVKKSLAIGSKKFDGSIEQEILLSDIVNNSTGINTVGYEGKDLKVNTIALAKLLFNNDTLILNGGTARG